MNTIIFLQVAIAFFMGIAALFLVYKILNFYLKKTFQLEELNMSFATLQVGIILSTALLMGSIVGPGLNAIRFINQSAVDLTTVSTSIGYIAVFIFIGVLFTMMIIGGGVLVLFQMTKVNEWEEIRKNNVPVALISAALILGLTLILKDNVAGLCEALIPYPDVVGVK
jgi:uncharacterized membrane protein YjfL (UPF0719 family)